MSIRKRALALVLVLVLLAGLLPAGALASGAAYTDVPEDYWAAPYIQRVTEEGLMKGTSSTTFSPLEVTTRGMFVTILARFAKAEVDNDALTRFDDVPTGMYYTGAVAWASELGIVNGVSDTEFAPDVPVTREQMAALLFRGIEGPGLCLRAERQPGRLYRRGGHPGLCPGGRGLGGGRRPAQRL